MGEVLELCPGIGFSIELKPSTRPVGMTPESIPDIVDGLQPVLRFFLIRCARVRRLALGLLGPGPPAHRTAAQGDACRGPGDRAADLEPACACCIRAAHAKCLAPAGAGDGPA